MHKRIKKKSRSSQSHPHSTHRKCEKGCRRTLARVNLNLFMGMFQLGAEYNHLLNRSQSEQIVHLLPEPMMSQPHLFMH